MLSTLWPNINSIILKLKKNSFNTQFMYNTHIVPQIISQLYCLTETKKTLFYFFYLTSHLSAKQKKKAKTVTTSSKTIQFQSKKSNCNATAQKGPCHTPTPKKPKPHLQKNLHPLIFSPKQQQRI